MELQSSSLEWTKYIK